MFKRYAAIKTIYLITQFNHPRELTEESATAIRALIDRGVAVKNQTVLLRGVNDNADTLEDLLKGLTRCGIAPYYLFQCRPVAGVKERFQVPLLEGCEIVHAAMSRQNGLGKSLRFVMSHPLGKIEIIGLLPNGETAFKFHQNKHPEDASRIFSRRLSASDTWLDDELNAIVM